MKAGMTVALGRGLRLSLLLISLLSFAVLLDNFLTLPDAKAAALVFREPVGGSPPAVPLTDPPPTVVVAAQSPASLVASDQVFSVTIQIQAGTSTNVAGAQAYLDFDATKLQLVDASGTATDRATPCGPLSQNLTNSADNILGRLNYAAGTPFSGSAPSGTFCLATAHFKPRVQTGTTAVSFSTGGGRTTDVVMPGGLATNVQASGATISIAPHLSASYVSSPPTLWGTGTTKTYTVTVTNTGADTWSASDPSWWDAAYNYMRQSLIANSASTPLPVGYTAVLLLSGSDAGAVFAHSLTDGRDLRVAYRNGSGWLELDRELVSFGAGNIEVRFKTQADIPAGGSDGNYYLYYGNPSAGAPPANKSNVYALWEDFSSYPVGSPPPSSVWTMPSSSGSWTVANTAGVLDGNYLRQDGRTAPNWIHQPGGMAYITNQIATATGNEVVVEAKLRAFSPSRNLAPSIAVRYDLGTQNWMVVEYFAGHLYLWPIVGGVGQTWAQDVTIPGGLDVVGADHTYRYVGLGNNHRVWIDNTLYADANYAMSAGSRLGLGSFGDQVGFDDIKVRALVSPEPVVSTSGEHNRPAGGDPASWVRLSVSFGGSNDNPGTWTTDQRFSLPSNVAPGASVSLSVNVTAPTTAADYTLRHRMVKETGTWFDQMQRTSVNVKPPLSASYSSSSPTSWLAYHSQSYNVTVTNTGADTWNATGANNVRLGIHFGTNDDTPGVGWATDQRFNLPYDVAPGQSVTLAVTVTAPSAHGSYVLRHRMVKEGVGWFAYINKTNVTVQIYCLTGQYLAQYYNTTDLTGTPVLERCETSSVNYEWGLDSPAPGVNPDYFSIRWNGTFDFSPGTYLFVANARDGVRVWLDGALIIDAWSGNFTTYTVVRTLTGGQHTVRVEHFDGIYEASVRATWSMVCPSGQYYAQYYNWDFGNQRTDGCEPSPINHNWGGGSPNSWVQEDNFLARWSGVFYFSGGYYTFVATTDDGMRAWVDDVPIVDVWWDQGASTYYVGRSLAAGFHTIRVEYYENAGDAVAALSW